MEWDNSRHNNNNELEEKQQQQQQQQRIFMHCFLRGDGEGAYAQMITLGLGRHFF